MGEPAIERRGALGDQGVGIVGGGVMAEAMLAGLLRDGLLDAGRVACSDPQAARRELLHERYGVRTHERNAGAVSDAGIIVLAVKPQALGEVIGELRDSLSPGQLVISIVAGATTAALQRGLAHAAVVRAMPNTPAQLGRGVTVWFAATEVTAERRAQARLVLSAIGRELEVPEERQVAMATAVSGSGPGYVLLFMEAMVGAAVELGFTPDVARELVQRTVEGSAALAVQTDADLAVLREMVTSPGGTTARGLQRLQSGGVRAAVGDAIRAAFERTLELERLVEEGTSAADAPVPREGRGTPA